MQNRRSLILGAALGSVMPSLVRAESMIDIPGDPLSRYGLRAAEQWATREFSEKPGCRLVFASGYAHRWFEYQNLVRHEKNGIAVDHAVALEVAVTDAKGRRFVQSIPIDAVGIEKAATERRKRQIAKLECEWDW